MRDNMKKAWEWFADRAWLMTVTAMAPMNMMVAMCDRCNVDMAVLMGIFATWGTFGLIMWLDDKIRG